MKSVRIALVLVALLIALPVGAQEARVELSESYRNALKVEKRKWIEQNMSLTAQQAKAFWPLYDHYQKDLAPILKELKEVIEVYADHYRKNTLTDAEAQQLYSRVLVVEERELALRRTFLDWVGRALSARIAVRYLQLEARRMTVIRFELAQNIPLVGDQPAGGPKK